MEVDPLQVLEVDPAHPDQLQRLIDDVQEREDWEEVLKATNYLSEQLPELLKTAQGLKPMLRVRSSIFVFLK